MGSLQTEGGPILPLKRVKNLSRSSSIFNTPRSSFSRFLLFQKLDYFQWLCAVAIFFFFVVLFHMYLPAARINMKEEERMISGYGEEFLLLKELELGTDLRFEPSDKVLAKFRKEGSKVYGTRMKLGWRKPQLALVFPDLLVDPHQILMVTVTAALQEIGYQIQVYSLEDGPMHAIWKNMGISVNFLQSRDDKEIAVDWLSYDGILVNYLEARCIFSRFVQEPFKSLPLIWTIHERTLATRLGQYNSSGQTELINDWKKIFSRATVVVFPNYVLPVLYSTLDTGNYYVIPGSPKEPWEVDNFMTLQIDDLRQRMGFEADDFVITIVGSQFLYRGLWLEHALVLQALFPLFTDFQSDDNSDVHLKIIVLSGNSASKFQLVVEAIALNLRYPRGAVKHIPIDGDADSALATSDLVVYGSFLEEQSFPDILIKAMCFGKLIVAPDLAMISNHVDDGVNGYLFPRDKIEVLMQVILQIVSNGTLSPKVLGIATTGKHYAKNLMVSLTVEGYASLVENVLKLPSEVAPPRNLSDIPPNLKETWKWMPFGAIAYPMYVNRTIRSANLLDKIEQQVNDSRKEGSIPVTGLDEGFVYSIWEEQRDIQTAYLSKRREEEELKDRTDQPRGTWEDVYRNAKKADRLKNDLHERDDSEIERTGQPLCIYEPYYGEGAWPFLHHTSLYRGIGLSSKGRRRGADDIDGPSRLPLLSNLYYRDVLGDHGAFFAIANRIDRVHRNSWIGFQSWRATARKESLSKIAEKAMIDATQVRKNGDTLYFWVRMDMDPRNPKQQDFWAFCDAINAGNCKLAFSEALKMMYGIKHNLSSLPAMPQDGDTWSVMHSWVLPTRSFLEFTMFSRMFVDALDAQIYDEHHQSGQCYLSLVRDKKCYSRVLELLINVWAYHSARRMVYVNPETGAMQEQHKLKSRRAKMWVKWFSYPTLKSLDEELAEEMDTDRRSRRWLWPSTGEVFWQGRYEREKNLRNQQKEKRRQQSKDKISRMRRKQRQKVIGKYVKPPPEDNELGSNSTSSFR